MPKKPQARATNRMGVISRLLIDESNEHGSVIFIMIVDKKLPCSRVQTPFVFSANPNIIIKIKPPALNNLLFWVYCKYILSICSLIC